MNATKHSLSETWRARLEFGRSRIAAAWASMRAGIENVKISGKRWYALLWHRIYGTHHRFTLWKAHYGVVAITSLLIILLAAGSGLLAPMLQHFLVPYFSVDAQLSWFRTLLVTLGGSLIGAAAIAFSFVMFAMQINVERMPHGLFRKLSSDYKLLVAFAAIFILAIVMATMSLIPDKSWLAIATLTAGWGILLILILSLYAYRRALRLINPIQQLMLILSGARRDLKTWVRRAHRAAPLLTGPNREIAEHEVPSRLTHDLQRVTYFQVNPHWTAVAQKGILYAVAFSRRYAAQGDHEVSNAALTTVVAINAAYVEAKGKTFFANNPMFENPLSSDALINDTLEHLRQNVQIAISRRDEQQLEQTFRAMTALCRLYLSIDYSDEYASTTHANLAVAYLLSAVQSAVPHGMPDVLMEGVRLLGEAGQIILDKGRMSDIATISEKIALISCTGAVREDYRPVTLTGVEQLARFTFSLIRNSTTDISYAVRKIREDMSRIVNIYLNLPDTPYSSIHSTYLAPYYSATSDTALQTWLTELANAIASANADDETVQKIIGNIDRWADKIYGTEKEIFLLALEKKSHFTFDSIHWITHITQLLLAISNTPACKEHIRERLRTSALLLVSVLSWVPDDKELIAFVENYGITETIFDSAVDALYRDCDEVAGQVRKLLLSWAFKAGKYETGGAILERSCYGLVVFDLMSGLDGARLKEEIAEHLTQENAPNQSIRDRSARDIRSQAVPRYRNPYPLSSIEYAMGQADQGKLRPLLIEIANILSPDTAMEPARPQAF